MNFSISLREGYARKVPVNRIIAKSLISSANEAIDSAKDIPILERKLKTIFRELYEGLRQYCEAIGYLKGYKFLSHESITYFLRDILKENSTSSRFDRYRELRNRINYYGKDISIESVKEALREIPEIIRYLRKYVSI